MTTSWTKEQLLAPLQAGMEAPPHPMRLGDSELDYYRQGPSFAAEQPADLLSVLASTAREARHDCPPHGAGGQRGQQHRGRDVVGAGNRGGLRRARHDLDQA